MLVWAGDEGLVEIYVVGEHADLAARRHRQDVVEPPGLRGLGNSRAAVQHVNRFIETAPTAGAAGRFDLRGGATRRTSQRRHFRRPLSQQIFSLGFLFL
jgi:hypothetical protein